MAEPLERLAERAAQDPFFLACALNLFAASETLDDVQLAQNLNCTPETLVLVKLCRAPGSEPGQFRKDIHRVASTYGIEEGLLAHAVRRGQALHAMRARPAARLFKAARDAEQPPGAEEKGDR
jgi:hypothetical protein